MTKSCCGKPIAKIIKVAHFEAGIVGLETALQNVYRAGINDEELAKTELLRFVREFGNYISPGTESDYENALLREYREFIVKTEQQSKKANSMR